MIILSKFIQIVQLIKEGNEIDFKKVYKNISSRIQLRNIADKPNNLTSICSFVVSLLKINPTLLILGLVFNLLNLGFIISTPFVNEYVIQTSQNKEIGWAVITILALQIVLFKIGKMIIIFVEDYVHSLLGFQYFANIYYHLLNKQQRFNGKILNILQTDCQKISNFPFALFILLINPIEIIVILGLLYHYLTIYQNNNWFFVIISVFLVLYCFAVYFNFQFNLQMLKLKDSRLNLNIQSLSKIQVLQKRQKQIEQIKYYLYIQIFTKLISSSYYVILFLFSFVWIDRQKIQQNKYIILILLGFIKTPIDRLIFASNLGSEIIYSIKRIIQTQRQNNFSDDSLMPLVPKIKITKFKCKQKGQISIHLLKQYYKDYVPTKLTIFWLALIIGTFLIKYFNFTFNRNILISEYSSLDLVGLTLQISIPLLYLFSFIQISQTLSQSIFKQIKQKCIQKQSPQFLNRISGDIISIDKSLCLNGFDLTSSLSFILGSLLFSLLSLKSVIMKVVFGGFILVCIYISFYFERYFMKSRREVARKEYFLKSKIIGCLYKEEKIDSSSLMKKAWANIYRCKHMGLIIEIGYNFIIFFILLIASLSLIICCILVDLPSAEKSIVIIACLQVDSDMLSMFISAIRFEKSLISCERIVNILRESQ